MPIGTFLNGTAPTRLRGLAFLAFTDVGRVGASTVVSDAGGGGTATWAYGADVPCRIDPLLGNEVSAADRISDRSTHLITAPAGTVVSVVSRFEIDGRGTFEVTAVREQTAELARFFEAVEVS